jgi:hypothetical protein
MIKEFNSPSDDAAMKYAAIIAKDSKLVAAAKDGRGDFIDAMKKYIWFGSNTKIADTVKSLISNIDISMRYKRRDLIDAVIEQLNNIQESKLNEMTQPLYKNWDQFEHPSKIKVYLNTGKTLEITPSQKAGGKKIYDAILQAFIDDRFDITNTVIQHMDKSKITEAKQIIKLDSFSGDDSEKIADFLNSEKIPFKKLGPIFTITLDRNTPKASIILSQLRRISKFDEVNESISFDKALDLRDEKAELNKELKQLRIDMEDEGNESKANYYGRQLNKLEDKLVKITKQLDDYDMSESRLGKPTSKSVTKLIESIVSQTILEAHEPVMFDPMIHKTPEMGAMDFTLMPDNKTVEVAMPFKEELELQVAVPVLKSYFDAISDTPINTQEDLDDLDYENVTRDIQNLFKRPDLFKKYITVK